MPDLPGLIRALRRRWKLAVFGGLICSSLAASTVYYFLQAVTYTTSALVFVSENRPKEIFDTRESIVAYATYQETQVTLVKSRKVLEAALKREGVANLASIRKQHDPISWLADRIKVDFPRGSEILRISVSGSQMPEDLEVLANAVTEAYLEQIVGQDNLERVARFERLKKLHESYQKEVRDKRRSYKELAEAMGTANKFSSALKQQLLVEHLGQSRQELQRVRGALREAEARLRISRARQANEGPSVEVAASVDAAQLIEADPDVRQMKGRMSELQSKLESLKKIIRRDNDPSIFRLQQEFNLVARDLQLRRRDLRRKLDGAAKGPTQVRQDQRVSEAEQNLDILKEQERALNEEIAVLDNEMRSLNSKSMDFQWLEDDINLTAETSRTVGTEVQSMNVELKAPPRTRLIERAQAPSLSDPLRRYKYTGAAAAGTLFAFLGALSLWEFRARRIDTVDAVVNGLGMRLVGSLPPIPRSTRGGGELVLQRMLIESIDTTRTMLLSACRSESLRLIMVTSALKGEGKTSLSCHLATSLARAGRNTLLIDCDLRSPSVAGVFCAPQEPGVSEFLRGDASLDDVIWQSPVEHLCVIPAGRSDPATIELIARDRLRDLLSAARERFEFVVIDSAPILLVTDSLIISQHVDAVIFSILREVSQLPAVYAAQESLSSLGVRVLGAVVSGASPSSYMRRSYPYPERNAEPRHDVPLG